MENRDPCNICGGDGTIDNAWGQKAKCPSCHGSGRRREDTGFHDVTKTKPSHYRQSNKAAVEEKQTWPTSPTGIALATEVKGSKLVEETKARLVREIIDHEASRGQVTKTFSTKMRKQVRPAT